MLLVFYTLVEVSKQHKNYERRQPDDDYFIHCGINYSITCAFALIIIYFREQIFTPSAFPDIKTIIFYFLVVDTIYYWMHRTIHRTPVLKKFLHEHHHEHDCIPLDFLNLTVSEFCLYMFNTNIAPLFFIPISIVNYFTIFIIIMFHSIYTHSELEGKFPIPGFIESDYHRHHHQIGRGNYAVFFSIWDDYMGTRIPIRQTEEKITETQTKTETNDTVK
jgi:sterol desaturase/sphingolipid hydroxylase (fatty acid hydroxylase superfamily)